MRLKVAGHDGLDGSVTGRDGGSRSQISTRFGEVLQHVVSAAAAVKRLGVLRVVSEHLRRPAEKQDGRGEYR